MISYVSEPNSGHLETKKVIPAEVSAFRKSFNLLTPFAFPLQRGLLSFSDPEGRGIKPLMINYIFYTSTDSWESIPLTQFPQNGDVVATKYVSFKSDRRSSFDNFWYTHIGFAGHSYFTVFKTVDFISNEWRSPFQGNKPAPFRGGISVIMCACSLE